MSYRNMDPQTPEETTTVSDREAFWTGMNHLLKVPAGLWLIVLCFCWTFLAVGLWDLIRFVKFRAIEVGHAQKGIDTDRVFEARLDVWRDRLWEVTQKEFKNFEAVRAACVIAAFFSWFMWITLLNLSLGAWAFGGPLDDSGFCIFFGFIAGVALTAISMAILSRKDI